jgi:hypothetical protein
LGKRWIAVIDEAVGTTERPEVDEGITGLRFILSLLFWMSLRGEPNCDRQRNE